jgi:hypothetical protein
MNQRDTSPGTAKGRRAWLLFSLLLPAFASKVVSMQSPASPTQADADTPPYPQESRPYLRVITTPPLRFEDPAPPPDLSARPPSGGPPKLPEKDKSDRGPDVLPPKPIVPEARPMGSTAPTVQGQSGMASSVKLTDTQTDAQTVTPPPAPTPPPILPDDVPSQVKPEDFLPYFQYPGSGRQNRGGDAPPQPLPRSTASYIQSE